MTMYQENAYHLRINPLKWIQL